MNWTQSCIRNFVLALITLCASQPIFAGAAAVGEKTLEEITIQPIAASSPLVKRALIIGIENYEAADPLSVPHEDAKAFAALLQTRFGFPAGSITMMIDEVSTPEEKRPTFTRLNRAVNNFLNGVDKDSEVIVFFSGHGISVDNQDWLVPKDGDPQDVKKTCISYTELKNRLETKQPRRVLLVVDACRNLQKAKSLGGSNFGSDDAPNEPQIAELLSCRRTEVSFEGKPQDFRASVFTHFVLKALGGEAEAIDANKRAVTFDSLRRYVKNNVSRYVAQNYNASQNPDGRSNLGAMVLAPGESTPVANGTVPVAATIKTLDTTATLRVTSTPAGATVYVDGERKGATSLEMNYDLGFEKSKQVEVGVELGGYKREIKSVTLARGASVTLTFDLLPVASVPTRVDQSTQVNLIANGNMQVDQDGDGIPDNWPKPGKWMLYTSEGGNRFMRLISKESGQVIMSYHAFDLSATTRAIELTWKQRVTNLKVGEQRWHDARIMTEWVDANSKKLKNGPTAGSANADTIGWVERSKRFLVPPDARKLVILPTLFQVQSGTFDLDDFVLKPIDPALVPAAGQ